MQNRPPGKGPRPPAKRPPRPVEGGGRLKFKDAEGEQPPADGKATSDTRAKRKKQQAAKFAAHSAAGKADRPRLQFEDPAPAADNAPAPAQKEDAPPPSRKYQKAVRRVERAEQKVEQARDNLPAKRRLSFQPEPDGETGKPRRRLHFEQEVLPEYRKPSLPARGAGVAKTAAVMKLHSKIHESERQNVAVEATHKSELFMEQGVGRALRWQRNRRRSKPYRALHQAEQREAKEHLNLAWQTALRNNPELQRKNALAKWMQKQKIKRKYAQVAHEAKQTAQFTQNVVHAAGQIVRAEIFEQTRDRSIYAEQYQLYADTEVLPDDAVANLLDRVTVWPDGRVEVLLKFLDELPALSGAAGRSEAAK